MACWLSEQASMAQRLCKDIDLNRSCTAPQEDFKDAVPPPEPQPAAVVAAA